MSNKRVTHIERPYPTVRAQQLTPKSGGRKSGKGQGGFWDVLD